MCISTYNDDACARLPGLRVAKVAKAPPLMSALACAIKLAVFAHRLYSAHRHGPDQLVGLGS